MPWKGQMNSSSRASRTWFHKPRLIRSMCGRAISPASSGSAMDSSSSSRRRCTEDNEWKAANKVAMPAR